MVASTVTVDDIRNLAQKRLVVQMPDYKSMVSARNQVTYVRKAYPLPKGMDYETHTDAENNIFEIVVTGEPIEMKK